MIQRDLESLSASELFPLTSEVQGKSNVWCWPPNAKLLSLPVMDISIALTFSLAEAYLWRVLPTHVLNDLQPYFQSADRTLESLSASSEAWRKKVAVIHDGPVFIRKPLSPEIQNNIYEALFRSRVLEVVYQARQGQPKSYALHPLGLVSKAGSLYLVATVNDFKDIRQFALTRFKAARMAQSDSLIPHGFSLQNYIEVDASFQYPLERFPAKLRLRVSDEFVFFFEENKLGEDQHIQKLASGYSELLVTTPLSEELEWWLMGRADVVEVLSPAHLRERMISKLRASLTFYQSNDSVMK
jgi:predicted DNA-binding transcriptional regulator YafY